MHKQIASNLYDHFPLLNTHQQFPAVNAKAGYWTGLKNLEDAFLRRMPSSGHKEKLY